jgi:DNA-binding transcriptional MerR regulator
MTDTAKRSMLRDLPHSSPARQPGPSRNCEPPNASRPSAIGDLAREFRISTRAIRFYESRGLLRPARRGTARIFGPADRQRLLLIIRAKNLGLTLEEIAEHLAIHDAAATTPEEIARLRERADRHIATLVGKRNDLQATLKELREIRARLSTDTEPKPS